jgi:uncharacterized Tic20 family protein
LKERKKERIAFQVSCRSWVVVVVVVVMIMVALHQ